MKQRSVWGAVCLLLALALLTGCSLPASEELYRLPRLSDEYLNLQELLDGVRDQGATYAVPQGEPRQSVCQADLDGDGVSEWAAFFRFPGQDRPLRMYVFRRSGDRYLEAAVISGKGAAFGDVLFPDMDGDGMAETAVTWRDESGGQTLSLYSLRQYNVRELVSAPCDDYCIGDLAGDGRRALALVQIRPGYLEGSATVYTLTPEGEAQSTAAPLSGGVERLAQLRLGTLAGGEPALFCDSVLNGSSLVTDVIALRQSRAVNVSAGPTGVSDGNLRLGTVCCRDIDGDGLTEIPSPRDASGFLLDWYQCDRRGTRTFRCLTCFDSSDGWYLLLPEYWGSMITVRRETAVAEEKAVVFYIESVEGDAVDILTVYTLTGDSRADRATVSGRFVLDRSDSAVWAARIADSAGEYVIRITRESIVEGFRVIRPD